MVTACSPFGASPSSRDRRRSGGAPTIVSRMLTKVLIANRGDIALRIVCACRELGLRTCVAHSQPDSDSLAVRFADEAVCIGPAASEQSYLSIPAILTAAAITGADALHPGYGFLSESASLAEACQAAGVVFIGPPPQVLHLLGDKARARRVMQAAGLQVVPGTESFDDPGEGARLAEALGFPVLIKATSGGGGRGLRGWRATRRWLHSAIRVSTWSDMSTTLVTSSFRCWRTRHGPCSSATASARCNGAIRRCSRRRRRWV